MRVANSLQIRKFCGFELWCIGFVSARRTLTPDEARQEAIERAGAGEFIGHNKAKVIVAQHKPAPAPAVTRPPGTEVLKAAYEQASKVFGPVTRPPETRYTQVEDDFVDDVPSVEVNDDSEPENATPFQVGDKVNTIHGRTGGLVIKTDPVDPLRTQVHFPGSDIYWTDAHWLVLANQSKPVVSQAHTDLAHVSDVDARKRLTAIVDQHESDWADRARRQADWREHERLRTLAAQTPPPEGQYRTIGD
jgi:hypothetical protein